MRAETETARKSTVEGRWSVSRMNLFFYEWPNKALIKIWIRHFTAVSLMWEEIGLKYKMDSSKKICNSLMQIHLSRDVL